MSRCFPFPPVGYEKKPRLEDADLLKEEKHREKKHKKKKDKEKGEGKEKREKDRSDGKHKEKKDKKDKHKDKEKNRDQKRDKENKSKDKEKKSGSEEAKAAGHPASSSTEPDKKNDHYKNVISPEKSAVKLQVQQGRNTVPIQVKDPAGETDESKFLQELGRRIRDEENGKGIQLAGRFSKSFAEDKGTNMERTNAIPPNITGASKSKVDGFPRAGVKEKYVEKSFDNRRIDEQTIKNESRFSGNAIAPNITVLSKSKVEGVPRPLEENNERKEEKERSKERDEKLGDKNKDKDGDKKRHKKDKNQEKEKKKEKSKEKSKHKETEPNRLQNINKIDVICSKTPEISRDSNAGSANDVNLKKRKIVTNGSLHENEMPRPVKMPRPASHEQIQNGNKVETFQVPPLTSNRQEGVEFKVVNKEHRINGAIHGQPLSVSRPKPLQSTIGAGQIAEASKKPLQAPNQIAEASRAIPPPHQISETFKKPLQASNQIAEAFRTSPAADQIAETSKKPLQATNHIAEASRAIPHADKIAEASRAIPHADKIAETSRKPRADQIAEASKKPPHPNLSVEAPKKPPHPDSKYLSQILTVPKMEEWIEDDDQEWLFRSENPSRHKKPRISSDDEELQVWSEAKYVESTDSYALPYVIPY